MMWRQYRVGCVVYNVHEQVMPESCHYLTALHAHSHSCLVSLHFIPSIIPHFLIRRIFILLVYTQCKSCGGKPYKNTYNYVRYGFLLVYTQCKSCGGKPYKNTYMLDMECLRLVLVMETLRYHCVQISPLWFVSLRSKEVVRKKCLRPFFVHGRHGNAEIHMCTKFHLHALHGLQV